MRGLEPATIPQATSMSSFMRQLGGVIGISGVGIGLEFRLAAHGADMRAAGAVDPAKLAAFDEIFVALALVMLAATAAAWFLKPGPHVHPGPDPGPAPR